MSRQFFIPPEAYLDLESQHSAYYRLLCQQDVDLVLTLNFNREGTVTEVRYQFGQLLARVDSQYLGTKWRRRHSDERAFGIGMTDRVSRISSSVPCGECPPEFERHRMQLTHTR